jgi:ATP-dependent 26S proteasome regulatory subunit
LSIESLKALFDAGHPCIRISTYEESEAIELVSEVASRLPAKPTVWVWSCASGLRDATIANAEPVPESHSAAVAIAGLRAKLGQPAVCIFLDLLDQLDDARVRREWREFVDWMLLESERRIPPTSATGAAFRGRAVTLVMIDHRSEALPLVESFSVRFDLAMPNDDEITEIVRKTLARLSKQSKITNELSTDESRAVIQNMRGLSRRQVAQVAHELVADDRKLTKADIARVIQSKRRLLQGVGVLEFVDSPTTLDDVGGLERLKKWLRQRERIFDTDASKFGLTPPRGVLLLGVQGAGKSLAAKSIATAWRRPLMRLEAGRLYDRYVGESERRLRDAFTQAEAMAPVVLWIDEIEKAFASAAAQSTDGGLSQRMFGALLTWMQDRTAPVFLVATANNIEALPPELLRKGRFDEIFFIDLPNDAARRQILTVHLTKRDQMTAAIDLPAVSSAADGLSGAEIEQAIIAALTTCFAENSALTTERLIEAITASPPLSITMAERIAELRAWAKGRCVPAD